MNRFYILISLALFLFSIGASAILTDNLEFYYKLDFAAPEDATGKFSATNYGADMLQSVAKINLSAKIVSANLDYIITDSFVSNTTNFTFGGWFNITADADNKHLIDVYVYIIK